MQPISDIKYIKLYYPFLLDRQITLKQQYRDILSYLLLADKVILPPDHIFNKNVVMKNADFLTKNDLVKQLFIHGQIISTATDNTIRDYKDLIFERANISNVTIPNFSIPLYFRDGKRQRDSYINFFLKEFSIAKNEFYQKDKAKQLINFVKSNQSHSNILKCIYNLNFIDSDRPFADYAKYIAKISYLKAGADGNFAIMPSIDSTNEHTFFNDYYSLRFVQEFAKRVSKQLKCDIVDLKFDKFIQLAESLRGFKESYFDKTSIFKDLDNDVFKALQEMNNADRYRTYKRGLNFIVGFVIGEIIDDILLPTLNLKTMESYSIKFFIAILFEKYRVLERVLSIANQIVDKKDFETYLITEFSEIIDKFDNTIKLVKNGG